MRVVVRIYIPMVVATTLLTVLNGWLGGSLVTTVLINMIGGGAAGAGIALFSLSPYFWAGHDLTAIVTEHDLSSMRLDQWEHMVDRWVHGNCRGPYVKTGPGHYQFRRDEDAVAFSIKWCDG